MRTDLKKGARREINRIVGIYALVGCTWILLSGRFLRLIAEPAMVSRIEVYKGLFFVLLTSGLLYQLIGGFVRRHADAVRQLAESEESFQTIYHNVNDALFIHDAASGEIVDVNQTMCNMFGYSHAEALQMQVQELSSGAAPYSQQEARRLLSLAAKGVPQTFEWRSKKKDGTVFWSEVNMRDTNINGHARVMVMVRDIDTRKKAEKALRQNEEILKVLMEEMPAGVGWADESGTIQYLNGCLIDWFGCTPAEVPTIEELMLRALAVDEQAPENRETWKSAIAAAREKHAAAPPVEARVVCRDGSVRRVILNIRLVQHRILFIFTDITRWEAMQAEILKAQKLESLGVMAGGIAHDFNNILTGILGNISFAGMLVEEAHPARKPLEHAEKASLRAAELAHQLLTFAKGGEPIKKSVSVAALVQECLSLVVHGSKVRTEVDIATSVHAIEADEGQINQAFNNVIINALQSMPGGGTLSVHGANVSLSAKNDLQLPPGDYVRIAFADQGGGISHENQKMIFDPYFTTKSGGTGLGLASVHSIVSRHNGSIQVDSSPGAGTTFSLYLPASGASSPEPEAAPEPALPEGGAEGVILVMDDEETIRTLATDMLEYLGYRVVTCGNGEEAVRLYIEAGEAGTTFHAAVMDLTVPAGMGGKEAARQILDYDPRARLIVSSGYSNDPVVAMHRDYGFCAAVIKPYRYAEMQQALACRNRT